MTLFAPSFSLLWISRKIHLVHCPIYPLYKHISSDFAMLSNIRTFSLTEHSFLPAHTHISNKLTFLLNCFNASLISSAHILLVFNSFYSLSLFSASPVTHSAVESVFDFVAITSSEGKINAYKNCIMCRCEIVFMTRLLGV
jgi:hypothetical protein